MKQTILLAISAVGITILTIGSFRHNNLLGASFDTTNEFYAVSATTTRKVTIQTVSTLIAATNTARQYLQIGHLGQLSAAKTIFLGLQDSAKAEQGIFLTASSTFTIDQKNLFKGAVYGISSTSQDVTVLEK